MFLGIEIREINLNGKEEEPTTETDYFYTQQYFSQQDIGHRIHKTLHDSIKSIKNINILPLFATSLDHQHHSEENHFQNQMITLILPLSGRYETFNRFIEYYEEICIKSDDNIQLIIILYQDPQNPKDYYQTKQLVRQLNEKYVRKKPIAIISMLGKAFSRGTALQVGVNNCDSNDLLFFIDVDIVFKSDAFAKVRLNTIRNKQVYFPIVFSEYNPIFNESVDVCSNKSELSIKTKLKYSNKIYHDVNFQISDDLGYWRQFGYGLMSAYKCDLVAIGGFNTNISGWGLEDVNVFEQFIKSDKLNIFRAPDPSLRHAYHVIECDRHLSEAQMKMCLGSQANTLGSLRTLYHFVSKNQFVLDTVDKYRRLKLRRPGS